VRLFKDAREPGFGLAILGDEVRKEGAGVDEDPFQRFVA